MNIDMLHTIHDNNLHTESNPLVDFCDRCCLTNTMKKPTRMTKSSKTLINVILVDRPERWATSGTLHLGMSDHDLVYIIRKERLPSSTVKTFESRSMRNCNLNAFLNDLSVTTWDSSFVFDDINDVWSHWYKLYNETIDGHAPKIKKGSPNQTILLDQQSAKKGNSIEK